MATFQVLLTHLQKPISLRGLIPKTAFMRPEERSIHQSYPLQDSPEANKYRLDYALKDEVNWLRKLENFLGLRKYLLMFPNVNYNNLELSDYDLANSFFFKSSFRETVLQRTTFSASNLSHTDLYGSDLSSANLSNASFIAANLIGADLTGAILNRTDFSGADLREVRFGNRFLTSEDLITRGCKVSGAKFTETVNL